MGRGGTLLASQNRRRETNLLSPTLSSILNGREGDALQPTDVGGYRGL